MKKLLIAIGLLLVFGITSAAISLSRGSADTLGSGGASGGSQDVAMDRNHARGGSGDGGSFSLAQGGGAASYMLSGGVGGVGGSSLTSQPGGPGYGGQGGDLSFEAWLQKFAEPFSRGYGPTANDDSVGDGARHAYSPEAPVARLDSLGAASPGSTSRTSALEEAGSLPDNVAAIPEPETYAMLLAGLCLVGVVARRRKSGQH